MYAKHFRFYAKYFGFEVEPFSVTPDPRFFYESPMYREAYAGLLFGVTGRKGFIGLTGEVGTGKTTLLRRLMASLETRARFVFVYNPTLTVDELLSFICAEWGMPVEGPGRLRKIQALNAFLVSQLERGGTGVLLIDEAQHLGEDTLESLRLLSNPETPTQKLLQIVLVGQPELTAKLSQPHLRQVKQRIAVQCRLERLREGEIGAYINHRLAAAGYPGGELFSRDAVREIGRCSGGIPRIINIVCDNALLIAYATSVRRASGEMIREVARDLALQPSTPGGNGVGAGAVGKLRQRSSVHGAAIDSARPGPTRLRSRPESALQRRGRAAVRRGALGLWVWVLGTFVLVVLMAVGAHLWLAKGPVGSSGKGELETVGRAVVPRTWPTHDRGVK